MATWIRERWRRVSLKSMNNVTYANQQTRKVSLPSDTKLKEDLDKMYRDVDRIIEHEEEELRPIDQEMLLFPHENAKQSWDLGPKSDAAMYTESFLHDLDQTTCTRVQKSKDTITIFADTEALLAIARQKILACEETFVCPLI